MYINSTRRVQKPSMTIRKADLDSLISRGASVLEDKDDFDINERVHVNLGIPKKMLAQIDEAVKKTVGISRTGWILQAIQQQLNNDGK